MQWVCKVKKDFNVNIFLDPESVFCYTEDPASVNMETEGGTLILKENDKVVFNLLEIEYTEHPKDKSPLAIRCCEITIFEKSDVQVEHTTGWFCNEQINLRSPDLDFFEVTTISSVNQSK